MVKTSSAYGSTVYWALVFRGCFIFPSTVEQTLFTWHLQRRHIPCSLTSSTQVFLTVRLTGPSWDYDLYRNSGDDNRE